MSEMDESGRDKTPDSSAELTVIAEADLREAEELLEAAKVRLALAQTDVTIAAERVKKTQAVLNWLRKNWSGGRPESKDGSDEKGDGDE